MITRLLLLLVLSHPMAANAETRLEACNHLAQKLIKQVNKGLRHSELEQIFKAHKVSEYGGLSAPSDKTFILEGCSEENIAVLIHVTFKIDQRNIKDANPTDTVIEISKPYIDSRANFF